MKTLHYTIDINADKKTVWDTMLNDVTYRKWTTAFHEGSYYEGSWDQGSEIRFLGPDDKGGLSGMYSRIKENIPYEFVSIEHLGMITNGVVDTTSEEVKKWTPAFENYTFKEEAGHTILSVDMQTPEEYEKMFNEMYPKALQILKSLCEQR
jgi:hypothetical protein